jgi:hypothetical protein
MANHIELYFLALLTSNLRVVFFMTLGLAGTFDLAASNPDCFLRLQ